MKPGRKKEKKPTTWNMKVLNDLVEMHTCAGDGPKDWDFIVKHLDASSIACLIEAVDNVLAGRVKLNGNQIKELRPHRDTLRRLTRVRRIDKSRETLRQTGGGFMAPLIPIILSIAANLLLK